MREINMTYHNIYYYCNIADNLLHLFTTDINWAPTAAQFTEMFFQESPLDFPKYSALHSFCEFVVEQIVYEDAQKVLELIQEKYDSIDSKISKEQRLQEAFKRYEDKNGKPILEIDRICNLLNLDCGTFFEYLLETDFEYLSDAYDDYLWPDGILEEIGPYFAREMFYVLFQNRDFLMRFNYYLSKSNDYTITRTALPQWVKRAVQYRDHGRCVMCGNDLSGKFDIPDNNSIHFDHIIPIHFGGLNDVSNIQLLCQKCNTKKQANAYTSTKYKDWYDFE